MEKKDYELVIREIDENGETYYLGTIKALP